MSMILKVAGVTALAAGLSFLLPAAGLRVFEGLGDRSWVKPEVGFVSVSPGYDLQQGLDESKMLYLMPGVYEAHKTLVMPSDSALVGARTEGDDRRKDLFGRLMTAENWLRGCRSLVDGWALSNGPADGKWHKQYFDCSNPLPGVLAAKVVDLFGQASGAFDTSVRSWIDAKHSDYIILVKANTEHVRFAHLGFTGGMPR